MSKDSLGDRMKSKYEDPFRHVLPQRTYVIVRIDGKAFHTFTRKLTKPYSTELANCMDRAALALCEQMPGTCLAYGQSDEYSFLMTDFQDHSTDMWFSGNVQKIASVASSIFTAHFNAAWNDGQEIPKIALFDARVFVIPSRADIINYFIWRQQDATRNSLSMLAQHHFSAKELHGKSGTAKMAMLKTLGVDWSEALVPFQRGRTIVKVQTECSHTFIHKKTKLSQTVTARQASWLVDENMPVLSGAQHLPGSYLDFIPYQT